MRILPYSRQNIDKDDINAVVKVLKSDYLTQGPNVSIFEKKLSQKVGSKYGIAVNSATSALHIACVSLDIRKGDIVWTSANSFVASINCAKYLGAEVDFIDIEEKFYNLSITDLEKKLILAKKKKKLPKLIIAVHFAGFPCDLKKLYKFSKLYKFKIIEDASHALGAKYYGNYIGNCNYSEVIIFSFHPVKIITSGEGGMCLTNKKKLRDKMLLLRSHGITNDPKKYINKKYKEPWYYEQQILGYNYRLSDIHASLGISQLKKLDKFVKQRNLIANNYLKLLKNLPIILPKKNKYLLSSFHLFIIRLDFHKTKKTYNQLFNYLRKNKMWVNLHYLPIYSHPFHKKKLKKNEFINTENYSRSAISIPIFPGLKIKEQIFVKKKLDIFFKNEKN
jgi:UDP-4-amino-4,6-dideoxy-N-acetyl-beta-L-altrosamine transaminase